MPVNKLPHRPAKPARNTAGKCKPTGSYRRRWIAKWLDRDKLEHQRELHDKLGQMRAYKACEFLLNDAKFAKWESGTGCQQLVIVGELGSGKSVAMSFLIDRLRRQWHLTQKPPQPQVVCYHYCQNETSVEVTHVFSVLILSLIEQVPCGKERLIDWQKLTSAGMTLAKDFKPLEKWLKTTLETIQITLVFAVDGLDECDEEPRRQLISALKAISDKNSNIKLLLSTRPEEGILEQLKGMSQIFMESNPERDRLIAEKTVETRFRWLALSDEVKALIVDSLSLSAQGSGIWTKMMVDLIAERWMTVGLTAGHRMMKPESIHELLYTKEPPEDLLDIYYDIYLRQIRSIPENPYPDKAGNDLAAFAALETLAVAKRPLSILELGWATALGAAPHKPRTVNDLSKLVDCKLVMHLVHPFVARVDFADLTKRQVKLVHPSVREFFFRSIQVLQCIQTAEEGLPSTCIRYLLLDEIDSKPLFSEDRSSLEELPPSVDLFTDTPAPTQPAPEFCWDDWEQDMSHSNAADRGFGELFVYASCHWLDHLGAVSEWQLLPLSFQLDPLCYAGSTRMHNWIAQYSRPGCTMQPRFEFGSGLYDPLSIVCLFGSNAMLQQILERTFYPEAYLPDSVMRAADQILQWKDLDRIKVLWESKAGPQQLQSLEFFCLVLDRWSISSTERYRVGWDGVFALLEDICDKMVKEQWDRSVLGKAIAVGCLPVVQRLFEAAKDRPHLMAELTDRTQGDISLVEIAVWANNAEVLKYLLEQLGQEYLRTHVKQGDARDILRLAARFCNPAIFKELVPRLTDCVNKKDQAGQAVLDVLSSGAASEDRLEVTGILVAWVFGDGRSCGLEAEFQRLVLVERES